MEESIKYLVKENERITKELDNIKEIEKEHQKENGRLREENKELNEIFRTANNITYMYNKDTKIYSVPYTEMKKIDLKLNERFKFKQENKQLKKQLEDSGYDGANQVADLLLQIQDLKIQISAREEIIEKAKKFINNLTYFYSEENNEILFESNKLDLLDILNGDDNE